MIRITLSLFSLILMLLAGSVQQRAAAQAQPAAGITDYRQLGASLPPVRLVDTNGVVWNNDSLAGSSNLFVMFFNPTCGHCEDMTDALVKDAPMRHGNKVVLVAGNNMGEYLALFMKNHNVQSAPDMRVTLDSNQLIEKVYTYQNLPQVNVYDPQGKLIRVFTSVSTTDKLRPYYRTAGKRKKRR